jgi:hypothetical protein
MSSRDRTLLSVVAALLVVGAAWFLVLSPKREEAATLTSQAEVQRQALAQAQSDLATGLAAKRSFGRSYTTVARLGAAVPDDDNVASLLLQVEKAAEASRIDFRELATGQGSSSAAPAPAPPPPPATPGAPATQVATATLPPGAGVGSAGFPTMPFDFTFTGDFFRLSDFVGRLERFLVVHNRKLQISGRFMTLDGIALTAGPRGFPQIQANVKATAYLLPAAQGLTAGATPSGPAPAASTEPASTAGVTTASATPVTR